jgi:hypothetical protein
MGGEVFSPRVEELGEFEGEGDEPVKKIDDGGGSGGAPVTLELAQGRLGVVNLLHDKLGEPLANQKRKKKGGGCCPSPVAAMARRRRTNRGSGAAC